MRNIRFYLLGTVILLGILLNACFKPRYEYVYIDQEIKDYCIFNESSYWIYQDSITNNVDSVVLMQSSLEFVKRSGEWGNNRILESYKSEYCHYLSDTSMVFSNNYSDEVLFPIVVFDSEIQNREKNIILRVSPGGIYSTSYYLPSYNIKENIFNEVKVLLANNVIRGEISDYSIKCYWVRSIGLIRYELYNSNEEILNTYNLVKYNVKPYNQ